MTTLTVDGVEISDHREKTNALSKVMASKITDGAVTVFPYCTSHDLSSLALTHWHKSCVDLVKAILDCMYFRE